MKQILDLQLQEILTNVNHIPCISLVINFEPKLSGRNELEQKLKAHQQRIERQLVQEYPSEKAMPLVEKLQAAIRNVNYNSYKKSLALYVSENIQKTYYLNIEVTEKSIIDDSFEIRDLVLSKKEQRKFLVLHVAEQHSSFYVFEEGQLSRIRTNSFSHLRHKLGDLPAIVDMEKQRQILVEKFLLLTDECIPGILSDHPFPIFVLGKENIVSGFKKISNSLPSIIRFIVGEFDVLNERQVAAVLSPHLDQWKQVFVQSLLMRVEAAFSASLLACGMEEVWTEAYRNNCRLLIVENDYSCPAQHGATADQMRFTGTTSGFYIKDAVDDAIEMVLLNGGDVEFVEPGSLRHFNQIAAIRVK